MHVTNGQTRGDPEGTAETLVAQTPQRLLLEILFSLRVYAELTGTDYTAADTLAGRRHRHLHAAAQRAGQPLVIAEDPSTARGLSPANAAQPTIGSYPARPLSRGRYRLPADDAAPPPAARNEHREETHGQ